MIGALLAGQGATDTSGPSAPPSNPGAHTTGSGVTVTWTNGDSTAGTQILQDGSVVATRSPGLASYDTGDTAAVYNASAWTARHIKNGQTSSSITFPSVSSGGGTL